MRKIRISNTYFIKHGFSRLNYHFEINNGKVKSICFFIFLLILILNIILQEKTIFFFLGDN
jgi:hypothetical protein